MKPDARVFEIRFDGLYEPPTVVALTDGELKNPQEILKVVPASELARIKGLLDLATRQLEKECTCTTEAGVLCDCCQLVEKIRGK